MDRNHLRYLYPPMRFGRCKPSLDRIMRVRQFTPSYEGNSKPPLCVDLDDTIIATDMLWESVLLLLKHQPFKLLLLPFWLLKGKAHLKRCVAELVPVDVRKLPYREDVLAFLRKERQAGRRLILATGADAKAASPVVDHLGIFDEVIASDGIVNLSGEKKRKALETRFGSGGFDYVGDSAGDLPVWQVAQTAYLVEPSRRTLTRVRQMAPVEQVFSNRRSRLRVYAQALRTYQWVKNLLVFVPVVTSHRVFDLLALAHAVSAFAAFSLCASSVYVLNDLLDLQSDRLHPKKGLRPFAAGELPIRVGAVLCPSLLACAFALSLLTLPYAFSAGLGTHIVISFGYSYYLKRLPVADVIALAGLYTLRVLLGGTATGISISPWLLAFSMFLFLSLAFAKRYAEVGVLQQTPQDMIPGRGYYSSDRAWMKDMGGPSGYLSVLVFAFYISSPDVVPLYRSPNLLWLACPALLYWVSRIWFLANRDQMDDDPIVFALKDPVSYGVVVWVILAMLLAL